MPESYSRKQVESALGEEGFYVVEQESSFTIYGNLKYPYGDLVLDWSRDEVEWEDLKAQLEANHIDSQAIHYFLLQSL